MDTGFCLLSQGAVGKGSISTVKAKSSRTAGRRPAGYKLARAEFRPEIKPNRTGQGGASVFHLDTMPRSMKQI